MQFAHNQAAALVTGTFVIAAVGAFYALRGVHLEQARLYLRHGTLAGLVASVLVAFPTGDAQAKIVARYQEPALAAMEGRFETGRMADITIIGQPNVRERRLDNPIKMRGLLSYLAYGTFHSEVRGLDAFPEDTWPTNIELLYYAFHVMAGLGTMFIALMTLATILRLLGRLDSTRAVLWMLMLAFPFPFIANTAGWLTAELGRQPWLVYGLFRTQAGFSDDGQFGRRAFHAHWHRRHVLRPRPPVSVSGRPGNRTRARRPAAGVAVRRVRPDGAGGGAWLNCGSRCSASC